MSSLAEAKEQLNITAEENFDLSSKLPRLQTTPKKQQQQQQQQQQIGSMKKSWSIDSFSSLSGKRTCICAPTNHEGSFRCKYHRNKPANQSQNQSQHLDAPSSALKLSISAEGQ